MSKTAAAHDVNSAKPQSYYWTGAALVFGSAFCFALKGIFIKMAYQYGIDTISLLTLRMVFSAPIFGFVAFRLYQQPANVALKKVEWLWVAALGVWGYYVSSYFNFLGFNYITAGMERVLLFTYPTFVVLIKDRKSTRLNSSHRNTSRMPSSA